MNKIIALLMLITVSSQSILSCPTCIGRLELQSPAFFSNELYELKPEDDIQMPSKKNTRDIQQDKKAEQDDEGDD